MDQTYLLALVVAIVVVMVAPRAHHDQAPAIRERGCR